MAYDRAIDAPMSLQWDSDSRLPSPDPGTAPNNCGPTSVEIIATAYSGKQYGIYNTRRLAVWGLGPTSIGDQALMLQKRGVDCYFSQLSLSQVKFYGSTGRWPIVLGLNMAWVPYETAGHPFRGMHAVVRATNSGVASGIIRDPNFNRTYRTDPTGGLRNYPDWVIQQSFVDRGGWALIPRKPMPEPRTWYGRIRVDGPGVSIRESAKEIPDNVFARSRTDGYTYRPDGRRIWANTYTYWWNGGVIRGDGGIDYYAVKTHNGNGKCIRVGAAVVVRQP